eukprot:978968-Karenia_brevis.AAC.1
MASQTLARSGPSSFCNVNGVCRHEAADAVMVTRCELCEVWSNSNNSRHHEEGAKIMKYEAAC